MRVQTWPATGAKPGNMSLTKAWSNLAGIAAASRAGRGWADAAERSRHRACTHEM